ncbi:MAG TPA: LPS export ABC transporter periplasmic protein LptC [Bacteroidales bacterium]|nr:LPS export ABC transporter periplasmic protein LptC [Bacteroidales bacterium]
MPNNKIVHKIIFVTTFLGFTTLFNIIPACKNDIKTIREIGLRDTNPTEILKNGELIYSDSGIVQLIIKTPLIKRYEKEKQYLEMPEGVKVFFLDSTKVANSWLTAKYAKSYDNDNKIEARNNVIVVNEKGERLDTERLVWDVRKKIIYSDLFVKITTKDKILFGDGMEADEQFNKWKIINPRGSFDIDQENL